MKDVITQEYDSPGIFLNWKWASVEGIWKVSWTNIVTVYKVMLPSLNIKVYLDYIKVYLHSLLFKFGLIGILLGIIASVIAISAEH